uniref:T cell immunoglobulin and mucin domain containing 4 n=1 Tax=Neogobius melanostomus TaxID=47308 RepID=A0A8C6T2Z8_9GOBI
IPPSWLAEWLACVCFWSAGCSSYRVTEGGVASLSCQYSVQRFGLSRVCWGRDCGTFWCSNILVQADENGVISKVSDRYRLTGDVLDGEMDLDILDVRRSDGGPYCCRVDVNGIFNDKKTIMNLRVVRAPGTSPPTTTTTTTTIITTTTTTTTTEGSLEETTPTGEQIEEPVPSLSVQINVPVLSLSLSVLFIVAAVALFVALKRTYCGKGLKSGCFSDEPRHIIYEIRMRRPVQENIYTLD